MNTTSNTNALLGIIEHKGRVFGASVPRHLLILDALAYATQRVEYCRTEAQDTDWTAKERKIYSDRADFLENWVANGGTEDVPLDVDMNLFLRTSHLPAVVNFENIDTYLDAILSVSEIISVWQVDEPQFALHNLESGVTLFLTDNIGLKNARRFAGPNTHVIETTSSQIMEFVVIQAEMSEFDSMADMEMVA